MSVSVEWNGLTAVVLKFVAPWTWEDYERISPEIEAAFNSVSHTVDLVIDVSQAGELPPNTLVYLGNSYADPTPNLGEYVFVGASDEFKAQFEAADRLYTALGGKLDYSFAK